MEQIEKLRSLIRESINEYIKEIDEAAETAAMEARIAKCDEAIQAREAKLGAIAESDHKDLMDEGKIKGLENEIKELKKAKAKFEKAKEKKAAKKDKKSAPKEDEVVTDAKVEESPVDEADVMEKMDVADEGMKEEALNESFLKMQKLAGIITEGQYNKKREALNENKIPAFRVKQVLSPSGMDKSNDQADLRVGLGYVIPKKHYSDINDIQQHMGKVTKIEGDKVFLETPKGEHQYKISDLAHIRDAAA